MNTVLVFSDKPDLNMDGSVCHGSASSRSVYASTCEHMTGDVKLLGQLKTLLSNGHTVRWLTYDSLDDRLFSAIKASVRKGTPVQLIGAVPPEFRERLLAYCGEVFA